MHFEPCVFAHRCRAYTCQIVCPGASSTSTSAPPTFPAHAPTRHPPLGYHVPNVKRFRGGLVVEAHRWLYHSTRGSRVIKKKKSTELPNPRHQNSACERVGGWGCPSAAALPLTDYSQVQSPGLWYTSVNARAGKSPGSPDWRARIDSGRRVGRESGLIPVSIQHECDSSPGHWSRSPNS